MKYDKAYWLNKDSRTILSRGYLQEGQEAEERIRQIAETAGKYLKDSTYADKFEDYLLRGWYSLASPVWSNYGTDRGLPISCVVGETLVETDKGPKQAKDIRLGDMVLTHKNRYREIQHIIITERSSDVYDFKTNDVKIKLTGNHPVLTNEGWVRVDELDKHTIANLIDGELVYKDIQELTKISDIHTVYDFTVAEDHSFIVDTVVLHNCNGSYVDDTMDSILEKAAEIGKQSKLGSGTSLFLGDLRARGTPISVGGESHGPVHFMEIYESIVNIVSQSNIRRGSCAVYLPVEHPDIKEFLNIREEGNSIQHLSMGVTITDRWMEEMIEGDKDKRKIWTRIIQKRFETGYPYIFFTDTVNNNAPQVYKDKNLKIHASNLCLVGETIISIEHKNNISSITLENFVKNWNDGVYYDVKVMTEYGYKKVTAAAQTGTSKQLIQISTNKNDILCTPDHKIFTKRGWVEAKYLTDGDILLEDGKEVSIDLISSIEDINVPVYDITVPETSSFYANNILVHNCAEIALSSNNDYSFVCCLSSMNLLHYDEWKDTDAVKVLTYFLDTVMEEYISKTSNIKFMESSHKFAKDQRAVGIGTLGWHSYLQSNMIPFESDRAKELNIEIQKFIHDQAYEASAELAQKFGEPELLKGYGRRNTTLLATAPTTSSAAILGQVSPSIEPLNSNYFVKDLAKGKFSYRNPFLKELLKKYNHDTPEVWDIILKSGGSVQNLFFLTDEEKAVFKTFGEISQWEIIKQAADRQKYIDQSQSLNLMIHPDTPLKDVNLLLIEAWKLGVKTLYYQRSTSKTQELVRNLVECKTCAL